MRVLVTDDAVWPWLRDSARLAEHGIRVEHVPYADREPVRELLPAVDAYVGVFLDGESARALGPGCSFVQITAAGTDQVALADIPVHVPVSNAFGHGPSVAEHVVLSLLALRRDLLWRDRELRAGRWRTRMVDPEAPRFRTLAGSTAGIVGFGHVGRSVARACRAMGMRVLAARRAPTGPDPDAELVTGMDGLPGLIADSDALVLACPLTEDTRGLIGRAELELLGSGGLLVNVARGAVVDEQALHEALVAGTIAGAALDVWHVPAGTGPPSALPFAELDSVLMTPHCSATAENTYADRAGEVVENLVRVRSGAQPQNLVRPGRAEPVR